MKMKLINPKMQKWMIEYETIKALMKANKIKKVNDRLKVIKLHLEGRTHKEIADKLDYSRPWVTHLIGEYRQKGLCEYARYKYGGNHRTLSDVEEDEIIRQFEEKMEKGEIVTVNDIKKAFDDKIGKDTGRGYIYMVLKRREFRKVMPRSKHPKKASEAEIEASKKLT